MSDKALDWGMELKDKRATEYPAGSLRGESGRDPEIVRERQREGHPYPTPPTLTPSILDCLHEPVWLYYFSH